MKQNKLRVFTFLLAVWLLIAALPISAFAELLELETQPMEDPTVYVLAEDTTKRSEFEKHYYCSDGTFVAVTYPEAVHYKDENGEWVDVDMRLASDASDASYESQSGDFKTVFRTPAASGDVSVMANGVSAATPAVSMQSGEYTLSWSLTGTKAAASAGASTYALNPAEDGGETIMSASADTQIQVLGEMKTAEAALSVQKIPVTDPDAFALPAVSNQVMYEDVFGTEQNVSVRYSVSLNKIEEDILITAPTEMTSFSMRIECGELSPVKNPDNSIDFLDNYGNMVYHVSTPYLADAAFAVSYDVSVTLTQQDGVCTITYTPDAEWMNAPERVYPIMLDPAVTTNEYTYAINDTYVVEGDDTCYYTNQYLLISQSDGKGRAAIIRFSTLPEIDPSMPIISAKLSLSTYIGPNGVDLKLESMESGFNFLMNKYSDWKTWNRTEIDRATYSTGTSVFEFDMTSCITDLYTGNISPDFSVSLYDEDSTTYVSAIHSADTAFGDYYRPCLTITYGYNLPEGLAVGDEITIQNLGSGGYLYPYSALIGNGNLVLHTPSNSSMAPYCMMTLRRNAANGTYKLEYTFYSDDSGAYLSADTSTKNVVMYNTTNVPSNIKQDWLIVPCGVNTFKIVLASDMSNVMFAETDASSTVSITQCTGTPTARQQWKIYKDGEQISNVIVNSPSIDQDYRYINNPVTGKFLKASLDALNTVGIASGRVSDLGDSIQWAFTRLPDGYYTIQNKAVPGQLLTGTGLPTFAMTTSNGSISNNQKWAVSLGITTYTITNVGTGQILAEIGYVRSTWRMVKCSNYVELGTFSFSDLTLSYGETGQLPMPLLDPYPNSPSGAIHFVSTTNDFVYDVIDEDVATVNSTTGVVNAVGRGTTRVDVTHKVTGEQQSFYVTVEKKAFIIIPGFGGSVLQMALGYPSYSEYNNKDIFSFERIELIQQGGAEAINDVNTLLTSLEDGQVLTGIFDYIQQFTNESYNTAYKNAIESLMLFFSMNCNDHGYSSYSISPKAFNAEEPDNSDKYGFGNTYQTLYANLSQLTLEQNGRYSGYEVTIFTYDWRLSCATAATQLNSFIESNQYDSVVLICHSTGGIVGSAYLSIGEEQQSIVEKYISYGTPHLGTTTSSLVCLSGDINMFYKLFAFENEWINAAAKQLIQQIFIRYMASNYSSVYELFPNQRFFNYNWGYVYECSDNLVDYVPYNYEETKNFISTHMKGYNTSLMEGAEELHNQICPLGNHVTYLVDSTYVFSKDYENPVSSSHECNNALFPSQCTASYEIEFDNVGDTVVHYRSATIGGVRNSSRFYEVHATHMDMIDLNYTDFYDIVNYQGGTS